MVKSIPLFFSWDRNLDVSTFIEEPATLDMQSLLTQSQKIVKEEELKWAVEEPLHPCENFYFEVTNSIFRVSSKWRFIERLSEVMNSKNSGFIDLEKAINASV